EAESGLVQRADKLDIAYFAQHQLDELNPAQSPFLAVRAVMPEAREAQIRARIDQMGLSSEKMDTAAGDLSGGEKARLLLGLATLSGPHLLILDEPTNHLDIDAREALVQALADYPGAVILISHDRHLIEASADRLWLVAGGTVAAFDGDIDDYRRLVLQGSGEREARPAETVAPKENAAERRRAAAERRKELAPLKKKIDKAEAEVARLNGFIAELDVKLADPNLFTANAAEGARLSKQRAEAEKALEAAEEAWLEMSHEYEELMLGD
ncbi:MAG: ATP-binding cassette domain-containing protein, partial [Hyphomicrobiales bacterium]|nr:ATP-binding cassette domain-containing protein [Hyphomicrobiales bacterium]